MAEAARPLLADEDTSVRRQALLTLASCDESEAAAAAVALADDPDDSVRFEGCTCQEVRRPGARSHFTVPDGWAGQAFELMARADHS